MELKLLTLVLVLTTIAHGQRAWCPDGSVEPCIANPCDIETCPSYPDATCLNDNPCNPWCDGHFYIEGRPRLSREECHGQSGDNPVAIPDWCRLRPGRRNRRCFVSPCQVKRCPAHPDAKCFADDPCSPFCSGHFYLGRSRLSRAECRRGRQ